MEVFLWLVCLATLGSSSPIQKADDDDVRLTVPELIAKYGYPVEVHYVTTIDGFVLCMHRIPHGIKGPTGKRRPFFVQHGILSSSADWIIAGPEKGLGYILADKGYDVWMGNFRGNKYSRNHTYLDPDEGDEFWDFSWHEMGIRDLPTMIDYVLEQTGSEQLLHVGHSQGTTTFYLMLSELPEYNEKIIAHISMAPIAFMNHMTSPLMKLMAFFDGPLEALLDLIGINEFLPSHSLIAGIGEALCGDNQITQPLCTNALFVICGFNPKQMNATLIPIIMGHTPAGSSVKQFLHFAQNIKNIFGVFRQYDYGLFENLKRYQKATPPSYDLGRVTAPVYLIYSHNDWLSAPSDVNKLYEKLGNARGKFLVTDEKFNHIDYLFAIDVVKLVYSKVISFAAKH